MTISSNFRLPNLWLALAGEPHCARRLVHWLAMFQPGHFRMKVYCNQGRMVDPISLRQQAKAGNPEAIAILINQSLKSKGFTITTEREAAQLKIKDFGAN